MVKQRSIYIDYLRGVAMLMVVYSHIMSFSLGHLEPSPLGQWMRDVMLPLFFFISGFCAYKLNWDMSLNGLCSQLWKKTRSILFPTIIMFLLFMLYSHNDMAYYAVAYDKSGYWFTWVLFQIFVVYYFTIYFAGKINSRWVKVVIICFPLLLFSVFSHFVGFSSLTAMTFELVKVKQFYLFFLVGLFVRQFESDVIKLLKKPIVNFILLILSFVSYVKFGTWIAGANTMILSVILLWFIFFSFNNYLVKSENRVVKLFQLIGRNTLAVYFIHFFLLFRIPMLPSYLESMKCDVVFGTHSCNSVVELLTVGTIAIIISLVSITIANILKFFPIAYTLCLGPIKHKSQR